MLRIRSLVCILRADHYNCTRMKPAMPRLSHFMATLTLVAACFSACEVANAQTAARFTVDTNRPNNSTYVLDEDVELNFSATGLTPLTTTSLAVTVLNELGVTIASHSLPLKVDSYGRASVAYRAPSWLYGYYRVDAKLPNGAVVPNLGTRPAGFISYAVIPDPNKRVNYGDVSSRFGFCGGFNNKQGNLMQLLGARYLLDGPGWATLEKDYPGQFAQARSQAVANGQTYPWHMANNNAPWPTYAMTVMMTSSEPVWAIVPGTGTTAWPTMGVLNSTGQNGFFAFTKARAAATAADFPTQSSRYYQITWEPEVPNGFGGTPAQLVEFYRLAHAAIHQADSKAIVMGPTMLPMDNTSLAPLYAAGLANYIDAVSVHTYAHWPPETHALPSNLQTQIQMARTAKGHSIPFISTEHGYSSGPGSSLAAPGELDQALGNIRTSLIVLGEGFKVDFAFYTADYWSVNASETTGTFGYYWNLNPKMPFGTDKVGPKPAVPAYAAMTHFLDGTLTTGVVSEVTGTQIGYRFKRGTTTILALWDYGAAATLVSIPVTGEVPNICDWMGNCRPFAPTNGRLRVHLSAAPTYVVGQNL
jgi:hypothetical protein